MSHTNFNRKSSNRKSLSLKSQLLQSFLNLGTAHEEFPQQAGTIVLNHRGNGALVDGKIAGHRPVTSLGEGIVESVLAPNPVAFGIEILPYTPEESMRALKYFYSKGDWIWGKYGFYDAFSEGSDWTRLLSV
jgi:hypothetical protein